MTLTRRSFSPSMMLKTSERNWRRKLQQKCNAVNYSLFLCAYLPAQRSQARALSQCHPRKPPFVPPDPPSWRTGIKSADGKHVYRASILDFFWAKNKVHAKAMTGLVNTYNLVDKQGHMSITTTADEYRSRFLEMCSEIIEVRDDAATS